MLIQRVLSAAVGIPIVLLAVWVGDPAHFPVYSLLVAAVALWAAMEFYGLATHAGHTPLRIFGGLLSTLLVANAYLVGHFRLDVGAALWAGALLVSLSLLLLRRNFEGLLADWAITLVGALYTGGLLSYFVLLRQLPDGMAWVLLAAFCTFAADTGAYFVGRSWGRKPLAPVISPKKTVEGALGGLVAGALAAVALAELLGLPLLPLGAAALGLIVAVAAEVGDLAESMLKRSTHTKDASNLIPGHGGILDRIDSLVFTIVVVYYYVVIHPF